MTNMIKNTSLIQIKKWHNTMTQRTGQMLILLEVSFFTIKLKKKDLTKKFQKK